MRLPRNRPPTHPGEIFREEFLVSLGLTPAATGNVGSVLLFFERLAEAGDRLRRRLEIAREIGARRDEGTSLLSLGRLEGGLGDLDGAGEKIGQAREILREIGVRQEEGYAISGLGEVATAVGDTARARGLFEEALALFLEIGHRVGTAHVRNLLGQNLLNEGRYGEAEGQLQGARELGRDLGLSVAVVLAEAGLALLPGADPAPALEAFAKHEGEITAGARMEIRFLHDRVTNDPAHLREAHDLLESLLKNAPDDARVAMVENVSGYLRTREAWEARGEVSSGSSEPDDSSPRCNALFVSFGRPEAVPDAPDVVCPSRRTRRSSTP